MAKFHIDNRTLGVILLICVALFFIDVPFVDEDGLAKIVIFLICLYMIVKG